MASREPDELEAGEKTPLVDGYGEIGDRGWRVSLCSFKYPRNSCLTSWCPCVRFAQTAVRARTHPKLGYVGWVVFYLSAILIFFMPFVWSRRCSVKITNNYSRCVLPVVSRVKCAS